MSVRDVSKLSNAELEKLTRSFSRYGLLPGEEKPKRKRPTRIQKRANASKRSKQKRVAKALREFLKTQNPASKFAGAKIRRNKGSITIIPIKLPRRATR